MRNAFLSVALAGATLFTPPPEALAAERATASSVKKIAHKKSPVITECQLEANAHRVRADVVFDLETGEKIYSSLPDEQITTKEIHPASLTKLEGIKEMARRVWSGLWSKDKTFEVANRPKDRPQARDLDAIARMSLVTSFNVMDQVAKADPSFMDGIRAYIKKIGMTKTTYLSPTGDPDGLPDVRRNHVTTVHDLMLSIRDYHLNYTDPTKVEKAFGRPQVSGLVNISDIPNIHRATHTLSLLEGAEGKKANPVPGVTDGKTGYTCASGWSEYFKYTVNNRPFIFVTLGHNSAEERQTQGLKLIETQRPSLEAFARKAAPQPVVPEVKLLPVSPADAASAVIAAEPPASSASSAPLAGLSFDPE